MDPTSPRIVFFGGQGSPALFSPLTATAAQKDAETCVSGLVLVSKCHAAFLEELSSLDRETKQLLGIDIAHFYALQDFLVPTKDYHCHGLVQSTTLCLYQLLRYIAEIERSGTGFGSSLNQILETTGFCAGLIPAVVVAASDTAEKFVRFGVEAFRLSFWIGCRATATSRSRETNQLLEPSWSLVVLGLDREQVAERLREFEKGHMRRTLHISAVSAHKNLSISGPGHDLSMFREHLGQSITTKFAHVHAWYHGGDILEGVAQEVTRDTDKRSVQLPSFDDLRKPIRSTLDGTILDRTDPKPLGIVQWITWHILVHCVDWVTVSSGLSEVVRETLAAQPRSRVQLISFGPSSGLLLADIKTQSAQSNVEILDLSPFKSTTTSTPSPYFQDGIAIVGMGINLPKGKGPKELWETLSNGLSGVQEIPDSRFKLSDFYSDAEDGKPRTMQVRHGAFLDDIWTFDNAFFNISPREAKSMDPQQRILLHTVQAALDDAGYVKDSTSSFQSSSMGCYIGLATGDYTDNLRDSVDVFYSQGTLRAFHSGRVSYIYKLSGPSIVTDTACSSSLVSIYQACRALQNGDCSAALAGGVNAICSPDMFLGLAKGHFLSSTGGCKPFDASADGYCRAEGCAVFVLKRLSDALAENDRIHGVIKDVMINQSGNAHSITHPHSETQVDLMRCILQKNNVDPASISVVEAHGTGTQAGDTREVASLQTFFGSSHSLANPLIVSSIKGSIGHCEAASGAAGLAKLLLMLRKREVPMQASLRKINPRITGLKDAGIIIPSKTTGWQHRHDSPRRAMLNNFGAAGSNSVLLLEELIACTSSSTHTHHDRSAYVFNVSAKSPDALSTLISKYKDFISMEAPDVSLKDICYTATARRQIYDYRVSFPCTSAQDLVSNLSNVDVSKIDIAKIKRRTIFMFSGQGSIYAGMGAELFQSSPLFKEIIISCDKILQDLGYSGILRMIDVVSTNMPEQADETAMSQCACVALEYGLAKLLMSWNVVPEFVIGHSLGEYAALAVSGVLSLHDTLQTVAYRAKLMVSMCAMEASGMVACKLSPFRAEEIIASSSRFSQLSIACRNSDNDSVVAGPLEQIGLFQEACNSQNLMTKKLDVPYGFHSAAMDPIMKPLKAFGSSVQWRQPDFPVMSTVSGRFLAKTDCTPDYFAQHARQPVAFQDSISYLTAEEYLDNAICLDIGPHPITMPMIHSAAAAGSCACIPTLQKGRQAWFSLSMALSQISMIKNNIDWRQMFDSSNAKMTDAPGHPLKGTKFEVPYQEHHKTSEIGQAERLSPYTDTGLSLLPKLMNLTSPNESLLFETTTVILGPLISGHQVGGTAICPASVFCELAIEGSQGILSTSQDEVLCVQDIKFSSPLVYDPSEESRSVQVQITKSETESTVKFKVTGRETRGNEETILCIGRVSVLAIQELQRHFLKDSAFVKRQSVYLHGVENRLLNKFQKKVIYDIIFPRVVRYSGDYQTLFELSVPESGLEGLGCFNLPITSNSGNCVTSPVFTDTLLHSAGFIANLSVSPDTICICAHVASIEILYGNIKHTEPFTIYCSLFDVIDGMITADSVALNAAGEVIGKIRGMEFKKLRLSTFQKLLGHAGTSNTKSERLPSKPAFGSSPVDDFNTSSASHSGMMNSFKDNSQSVRDTIAQIIKDVGGFQADDLGISTSLEALGIDSLMHIEITLKLKHAFPGHHIDHNKLASCESIEALMGMVMSMLSSIAEENESDSSKNIPSSRPASRAASSQSSLSESEKINPATLHTSYNSNTPMCLFHDGSGLVSMYAKIHDFDRSVYAFSDPSLFESRPLFSSLEQMTAQYVSQLSWLNLPSLILAGWSFGGVVALEAAKQLLTAGFPVKGLILIDSPNPVNHQPLPNKVIRHICRSAITGEGDPVSTANTTLFRQFQHNAALLAKYHSVKRAHPVYKTVMLRSRDTFDTQAACGVRYDWLSSQVARDEAVKGWEELLGGPIEVFPIPGNHFEAFSPENIFEVSKQLRRACRYIERAE